ncbi:hypothetical protein DFJ63DRAFT_332958 [Scheffersomyces coipomensis]|uniref:uncharacterized protein n=1 Tax=Scheffersomyces coipomensis TaxID=1788519 RepID=UPI00315CB410
MTYSKIAVIGGGPSGLAVAKALALEPVDFETIDLFERRDDVGGVWYFGGNKSNLTPLIPSLTPNSFDYDENTNVNDTFTSPMYKYLETNIPGKIMEYEDLHFSDDLPSFPSRDDVFDYIKYYSKSIPSGKVNWHFNSNIVSLTKINPTTWEIVGKSTIAPYNQFIKTYDAVVIANGHFGIPFIPDVKGLSHWNLQEPGSITHAKYYNDPQPFKDKTVLIIGNFASGQDISVQLLVNAKQIYVSIKDVEDSASQLTDTNDLIKYIGLVEEYNYDSNRSVKTVDNQIIENIDVVIFCTGYLYSIPFLKSYPDLITDGNQIHQVYKQTFYIPDPSLSLPGLSKNVIPMPIAESEGAIIARYYSGRWKLPSQEDMQVEYEAEIKERGTGKAFHSLPYPVDVAFYKSLQKIIDDNKLGDEGLIAPIWHDSRTQLRAECSPLKKERVKIAVEHALKLREQGEATFSLPDATL